MLDPLDETLATIETEAPVVVAGMMACEGLWIGGAAMMAASVGVRIGNPLRLKSTMSEIARKASRSSLFTLGLVVNTVGAVGEFAVPAMAVGRHLPATSWGILVPSAIDLGITVAVRRVVVVAVRSNADAAVAEG
jgi:hypothetical protein